MIVYDFCSVVNWCSAIHTFRLKETPEVMTSMLFVVYMIRDKLLFGTGVVQFEYFICSVLGIN